MTWHGALAWVLLGLLFGEICITLWDFIEEDNAGCPRANGDARRDGYRLASWPS